MLQALLQSNIRHERENDILKSDTFDYANASLLANEIVKLKTKPQCYICSNDFMARCVCNALALLNIRVPQDVFVIGYDDAIDSVSAHPTITTVGMNKEYLGAEAVRTLGYRIDNPTAPKRTITIDSVIKTRESTNRKIN